MSPNASLALGATVRVTTRASGRFDWFGEVVAVGALTRTVKFFYDHELRTYREDELAELAPETTPTPSATPGRGMSVVQAREDLPARNEGWLMAPEVEDAGCCVCDAKPGEVCLPSCPGRRSPRRPDAPQGDQPEAEEKEAPAAPARPKAGNAGPDVEPERSGLAIAAAGRSSSAGSAIETINQRLGLDAAVTHKGDQLKCYTRDIEEGGVSKTYLDADDCRLLSQAFAVVAGQFTSAIGGEK